MNWSFFESCHGKCYCDPEGGTLKNAARQYELHISDPSDQLKDSESFYRWASQKSGLDTPKLNLKQKRGRGIYRRFFYYVPSKGNGSVDRSHLPKLKAHGSSKLHEFVDIGVVGQVATRRASCHQCDECWAGNRYNCSNVGYVGQPKHLLIVSEALPAAAAVVRIERAALNRDSLSRATMAKLGSVVCIETHKDEQTVPWVIGVVTKELHDAPCASLPYNVANDLIHFEPFKAGEPSLQITLYEALQPGSTTFSLSTMSTLVAARTVRVIDVELVETRSSSRVTTEANRRYSIEAGSLRRIHAEMPTTNDDWEVEKVVQYRCQYGVEQWLVKWKNYTEDRNTWEPWENLLTTQVQEEARCVRTAALPRNHEGLMRLVLITLKSALEERGMDTSGSKVQLAARLQEVLLGST